MSELFLRTDDGRNIPIQKVEGLDGSEMLVVRMNIMLKDLEKSLYESKLSKQFGRRIIVLDSRYGEILSVKE